jgi:hypothetical protein
MINKHKVVGLKVCGNSLVLSKLTQGTTLLSCIQEESISNLSHDTDYADKVFMFFLSPSKQILRWYCHVLMTRQEVWPDNWIY